MMLPGTDMTRVGERPRHSVVKPSCRAIFLKPSSVELKVLRCTCSTAQSAETAAPVAEGPTGATQPSTLLFMKNTSLQHAVTPRLEGRKAFGLEIGIF